MPTGSATSFPPRIPVGLLWVLVGLFLTLPLAESAVAQAQITKTSQKPPEPVFPSAAPASSQPETSTPVDQAGPDTRLGPGDMLEISVYNVPELGTKSRLGNNGDVYLPLIDYVHVEGLTVEEAQALIEKRLSDGGFVKNPHVTLNVDQSFSQGASLLGEVSRPGVYPIIGEPRLLDVISAAGGFTSAAGRSITITHRDQSDKPVTVPLSRKLSDNPAINVPISPGDTILVHRADIVYAVGEVGRPSGFLMDTDNLTVLKVIALAGGTTRFAKTTGARIIRKGPDGMTETQIDLKKMLQAKIADLPMKPDDILFVPSSTGKVIMGRTVDVAMQAASAASIVAIRP
ncbi:MAG: polysaccharide biosynthesis/export family protein [Terriglobales bacterium]